MKRMHSVRILLVIAFVGVSLLVMSQTSVVSSEAMLYNVYGVVQEKDTHDNMLPAEAVEVLVSIPLTSRNTTTNHESAITNDSVILSTLTDQNGKFNIMLLPSTYFLTYRQMGEILRRDTIKLTRNMDLGDVVVDMGSIKLGEVVVKAQKKLLTYEQGKLAFNVVESPYAEGFNAKDVLQHIPGMDPDPNKILMIGKDGLIVLINGRRTNLSGEQLKHYLQSIESDKIEKVEIQTNPSPEYAASGNPGVINIVLKKNTYLGLDGSVWTHYAQRNTPTAGIGGTISYSNKKFMFSYNADYYYIRQINENQDKYQYLDSSIIIDEWYQFKDHDIEQNLTTNFFINDKMDIGFISNLWIDRDNGTNKSSHSLYKFDTLTSQYKYRIPLNNKYVNFSISPYYEWRFDEEDKKMTVSYDYTYSHQKEKQTYLQDDTLFSSITYARNTTISHIGRIDIKLPFDWLSFEYGGYYSYTRDNSKSEYKSLATYKFNEQIGAWYFDIYRYWNKWNFKLGTRYEHTTFKGIPTDTLTFTKKYDNWFPFAEIGIKPHEKHSLIFSYNRRIDRPDISDYTPIRWYYGLTYMQGNPNLKPTIKENVELKYLYSNLQVNLSYSYTKNGIGSILQKDENNFLYTTSANNITGHSAGGYINYSYYHKKFNLFGSFSAYYSKYHSFDYRLDDSNMKGWSTSLNISGTVNLGKYTSLNTYYFSNFPGFGKGSRYSHNKIFHNWGINAKWKLLKETLIIDIGVNDIIGTAINKSWIRYKDEVGNEYIYYHTNDAKNRHGYITLTYKFGNNKVKYGDVEVESGNDRIGKR